MNTFPEPDEDLLALADRAMSTLATYHRHTVRGLGNLPESGPGLLVVNHSMITYDVLMLQMHIFRETGRFARSLGDRALFKIPILAELTRAFGVVEGDPHAGQRLLDAGELVLVAPGGMREALRPSTEKYDLRWGRRKGFVELAIRTGAPVFLAACPRADDIFKVYQNPVTAAIYRRFRMPVPVFRGVGPTLIPRPVRLTHRIDEAWLPPKGPVTREKVSTAHDALTRRMITLMRQTLSD
ncbi:MAG: lysophospholipid acyltransferase family protein [Myxococcota bacterium]